jgi:hypothetical protein
MARYLVYAPTRGVSPILAAALTPPMHRVSVTESKGKVVGQPGTWAIRAPSPAAVPQNQYIALASTGDSRSSDSPDVQFPRMYWEADMPKEHAPVSMYSDNQMPVPARVSPNVIKADPYRARKGGQRQIYQPQVIQRWLGQRGTPNG